MSDKNKKVREKERKRIEIQKRKIQLEQERATRPGECNKFLTALVNKDLTQAHSGSKIREKLGEADIKVEVISNSLPNTITWKRAINKKIITDDGKVIEFDNVENDEPYLLMIIGAEEFVKASKDNNLLNIVQAAQEILPFYPQSTTLIIYGLKDFCRRQKHVIGIKETEIKLTQLQLLAVCSHRLHETPDDIALTVAQISRAIAEEPYKSKQYQKLDQEHLYLTSDVKVSVTDDPASLSRLWQIQLTSLPKVTYEIAQSIIKEYPLPKTLIEAYKKSINPEKMLADIPIIRTGPLSKTRKLGPDLSRKIYTLMMSDNPEDIL